MSNVTFGILINPFENSIQRVDCDGSLESIYDLLDCRTFDCMDANNAGDTIFIDDEGLFVRGQKFFAYWPYGVDQEYPRILGGKALILGSDMDGGSTNPKSALFDIINKVHFVSTAEAVKLAEQYNI